MSDKRKSERWIVLREDGYDLAFDGPLAEQALRDLGAWDQVKVIEYREHKALLQEALKLEAALEELRVFLDGLTVTPAPDAPSVNEVFIDKPLAQFKKWRGENG